MPGLTLYRWDAPLFFANAPTFREHVLGVVDALQETPRWLVVAAEPITDVDTTAAETLNELITDLARRGTQLHFATLKGPTKDRLAVYGIFARLGADHFHPTVGSAVSAYLDRYPDVEWEDWEDEPEPPEAEGPADAGRRGRTRTSATGHRRRTRSPWTLRAGSFRRRNPGSPRGPDPAPSGVPTAPAAEAPDAARSRGPGRRTPRRPTCRPSLRPADPGAARPLRPTARRALPDRAAHPARSSTRGRGAVARTGHDPVRA